jgi:hypothetical protein
MSSLIFIPMWKYIFLQFPPRHTEHFKWLQQSLWGKGIKQKFTFLHAFLVASISTVLGERRQRILNNIEEKVPYRLSRKPFNA